VSVGFDGEHKPDDGHAWRGIKTYHGHYTNDQTSRQYHGHIAGMVISYHFNLKSVDRNYFAFSLELCVLQLLEMGMTGIYSGCRPALCKRVDTQGKINWQVLYNAKLTRLPPRQTCCQYNHRIQHNKPSHADPQLA
jgi:hypothetical protein